MKFGGTSVGSAERIRQAASIVQQHARNHRVVVVVSALSKVTDLIISTLNAARAGDRTKMEDGLRSLRERHDQVLHELFHGSALQSVSAEVHAVLRRLSEFCSALSLLGSATPQVMDMVLPLGEHMSARIFTACLRELGATSAFIDSAQVIATDDKFGDASPDMDATRRHCTDVLSPLLQAGSIPVVMGYSGATSSGPVGRRPPRRPTPTPPQRPRSPRPSRAPVRPSPPRTPGPPR